MKRWRFRPVYLFSLYAALLFAISIAAGAFFYIRYAQTFEQIALQSLERLSTVRASQINDLFAVMNKTSINICYNASVQETMKALNRDQDRANYFYQNAGEEKRLKQVVSRLNLYGSSFSAIRICIFNQHGDYLVQSNKPAFLKATADFSQTSEAREIFNTFQQIKGAPYIVFCHGDYWDVRGEAQMISLFRPIIDLNTDEVLGAVQVQLLFSQLQRICEPGELDQATVLLLDEHCHAVYASDEQGVDLSKEDLQSGYGIMRRSQGKDGRPELVYLSALDYGLKLLVAFPESSFMAPIHSFKHILFLMAAALFLLTLLFFALTRRELYQPLKRLRQTMDTASLSTMTQLSTQYASNEIDRFNHSFGMMLERLNRSIEELQISKDYEAKAQMLALQSQMNPHFLHNTLAVIASIGNEKGDGRIGAICGALSAMLNYSASYTREKVTLRDEIKNLETYFWLMKQRYEEHFVYTIEVEACPLDTLVPRLIMQPLAENCFQHGFQSVAPPWEIGVRIYSRDGMWYVSMRDNGSGIADKAVERVEHHVEAYFRNPKQELKRLAIGGLGLTSSFIRLKLFYGSGAYSHVSSNHHGGTTVTIGGYIMRNNEEWL